jgi:glycosyltransferase involved in cell wall biosynthesis
MALDGRRCGEIARRCRGHQLSPLACGLELREKLNMSRTILFISNMFRIPWGGSEELWTRAAGFLSRKGVSVAASVQGWPQLDRRIVELSRAGVDVRPRPVKPSLIALARRYMLGRAQIVLDIERSFGDGSPALVVISNAYGTPPTEIAELCVAKRWRFAILTHSSSPDWWPSGEVAAQARQALTLARRCFFISESNRILAEKQLGHDFDNAEIVRNPLIIETDLPFPWPLDPIDHELRMACVARLSGEKGQDILLEALASPRWMERPWRLTFFGVGPTRDVLERLVARLKLQDRVVFAGHVAIEEIWRENHVLVVPSRLEGGPMTTIEAMFCGRPVVATSVGLNPEVIKDGFTGFLAAYPAVECLSEALERMWMQRDKLQEIGIRAAGSIREFMPDDPVEAFAGKLLSLASLPT